MNNTIQNTKIDELELRVIEEVAKYPFELFTVEKISGLIKINYATSYRRVDSLINQGILIKMPDYGMASQIKINLDSEKTISVLSLIEANRLERFFKKLKGNLSISVNEIIKDTNNLSDLKCVLVFGSYAKETQTKGSDLDILVIEEPSEVAMKLLKDKFENYLKEVRNSVIGILRTSELRGGPKISPIIVSNKEYREMILNKENNIAKEALLNHIILKGHRSYWEEIARCVHVK